MTQKPMYPTVTGNPHTIICADYTAGVDTDIYCNDASFLPSAPNLCTILSKDGNSLVTVKYTSVSAHLLSGVTVVQGYPATAVMQVFEVGCTLSKPIEQETIQSIQDNIREHETRIVALEEGGGGGGTNNYNQLINKPQINGVELKGNKTPAELGAVNKNQYSTVAFSLGRDTDGIYMDD